MHRFIITLFMIVCCSGCVGSFDNQRRQIWKENNRQIDELNKKCNELTADTEHLIYDEIGNDVAMANFVRDVCGSEAGKECLDKFFKMHMARMDEKYVGADWAAIKRYADGHPEIYSDSRKIEQLVAANHNANVAAFCDNKRKQIISHTNAAIKNVNNEQQQAIAEAFSAMSSQHQTTCYSSDSRVSCYSR